MDIDLLIRTNPRAGTTYRKGDIISVSKRGSSPCRHPRQALLRINDVPDKAPEAAMLRRLNRVLRASIEDLTNLSNIRRIRRRRWGLDIPNIPNTVKVALRDNKEFTGTWTQLKAHLVRRLVVVESDDTQDTLIPIEDDDL